MIAASPSSSFLLRLVRGYICCGMRHAAGQCGRSLGLAVAAPGEGHGPDSFSGLVPSHPIQQVSPRSLHFLLLATTNITILPPFSYCFHVHQSRKIARCKPCTPYCILYPQKIFGLCSGMRWCCSSSSEAMHKCMLYILHCM